MNPKPETRNSKFKDTFLSKRVIDLPPSGIRKFFDLVSATKGVISLGVGEPDFVTPWHIREAGIYSLEEGYTAYTSNYGLIELREGIARYLEEEYQAPFDPNTEILVTVGVSEGLDLALRTILDPGEEVIIPEPCYVSYKADTFLAGGVPVTIPTSLKDGFKVRAKAIEEAVSPRSKAILLGYPNNPTGAILTREKMLPILEIAQRHNLVIISDEIYGPLTYEGKHTSFASLPGAKERVILLSGFSKAYAMTGWRIGYAAANPPFIDAMTKIHQYTMLCAPILAQKAAVEALKNGQDACLDMLSSYDQRRHLITEGLRKIGFNCLMPRGAFYIFPNIKSSGLSSEEFAGRLVEEEKVAVVPGTAFGECGEGYIRCSYAASIEDIEEALKRIERFVRTTRKQR
ncbi:MAG: aminotransferase class I/II-fold pyridoxal phosphate-dependent enzyme [bacterium]|nr:aminotransferase class I/II-fold pyridoxal phosphate-dependent enzyme [bacterium]